MVWNEVRPPKSSDWCTACCDAAVSLITQDDQDDDVIISLGEQLRSLVGNGPAVELIKAWQVHMDAVIPDEQPDEDQVIETEPAGDFTATHK